MPPTIPPNSVTRIVSPAATGPLIASSTRNSVTVSIHPPGARLPRDAPAVATTIAFEAVTSARSDGTMKVAACAADARRTSEMSDRARITESISPQSHRGHRDDSVISVLLTHGFCARREDFSLTVLASSLHRESFSPAVFVGEKVPKADEGAALGTASRGKRPSPAVRVSLSPQEDAGRGTLERKDALVAAMPRCVSVVKSAPHETDRRTRQSRRGLRAFAAQHRVDDRRCVREKISHRNRETREGRHDRRGARRGRQRESGQA